MICATVLATKFQSGIKRCRFAAQESRGEQENEGGMLHDHRLVLWIVLIDFFVVFVVGLFLYCIPSC